MRRVEFLAKTLIGDLKKAFLLLYIEPGAKGQKRDLQFSKGITHEIPLVGFEALGVPIAKLFSTRDRTDFGLQGTHCARVRM